MAKTVYTSEAIKLQDDTEVTLVPLAIGLLRKFMKAFSEVGEVEPDNDGLDIYINCCGIALSKQVKGKFEQTLDTDPDSDEWLAEDYREWLEDVLDMETIFKIMNICGGIDLKNPKLLEEVEKATQEAQEQ